MIENLQMNHRQIIHCPNCGNSAHKSEIPHQNLISIDCPSCDYLIIRCPYSAKVLEAYAPGLKMRK